MPKHLLKYSWILLLLLASCDQGDPVKPEIMLEPSQTSVDYNGFFTLTWDAKKTDYCIASGDWLGNVRRSGSKSIGPLTRDSEYILDCFVSREPIRKSVRIQVGDPQKPSVQLLASPLSIAYNSGTTITWSTQDVSECQASGAWNGAREPNGSIRVDGLTTDSEFKLTCQSPQGEVSEIVRVDVFEQGIEVPVVKLTANPLSVPYQGSTTLSWTSDGADICRAWGDWSGSKARNGSEVIGQVNQDSRFILACTRAGDRGVEGRDAIEVRVIN